MGDGAFIAVVLVCGSLLVSSMCAAGVFLLYKTNPGLFGGMFGTAAPKDDGISTSAGKYACPMTYTHGDKQYTFSVDSSRDDHDKPMDGVPGFVRRWCVADGLDDTLASKLPADAKPGEIFDPPTLQRRGGIYGPKYGDSFNPYKVEADDGGRWKAFKYKASASTKAPA